MGLDGDGPPSLGPQPRLLGGFSDVQNGTCGGRVAGPMRVGGCDVKLPNSGDPVAS